MKPRVPGQKIAVTSTQLRRKNQSLVIKRHHLGISIFQIQPNPFSFVNKSSFSVKKKDQISSLSLSLRFQSSLDCLPQRYVFESPLFVSEESIPKLGFRYFTFHHRFRFRYESLFLYAWTSSRFDLYGALLRFPQVPPSLYASQAS